MAADARNALHTGWQAPAALTHHDAAGNLAFLGERGPRRAPFTPRPSERPGFPGALLYLSCEMRSANMARLTGGEALVKSLTRHGVKVVFGLPGVQIYGAVCALRDERGVRFIQCRNESATSYM